MKKVKQILKYILYGILAIFVSLCLYVFLSTTIFQKEYASIFGYTYFQVKTGSMSGTIEPNDLIIVKETDNIKEKDIITFRNESSFVTHRVLKISGDSIITKGDANNIEDEVIVKKDVIGKVVLVISLALVLKIIAVIIILFILFTIINFDKIMEKLVNKGKDDDSDIVTGKTIKIPVEQILAMNQQQKKEDDIEVLEEFTRETEIIDLEYILEEEFINKVLNFLEFKNNGKKTTVINKKWKEKLEYVYKLSSIILIDDQSQLEQEYKKIEFTELFHYNMEKTGITKEFQEKIEDMPIYVYIKIMLFAIIYSDEEFFDGIYKLFKYRIQVDKKHYFTSLKKKNKSKRRREKEEVIKLVTFMNRFARQHDKNDFLEFELVLERIKLNYYMNHK